MKRKQKRIVGYFSLVVVFALTIFAAFLPTPEASAANSSVIDTLTVRVIGNSPGAHITNPGNGAVFVGPDQTITYTYENADTVTLTLKYTDMNGVTTTDTLDVVAAGQQPGSGSFNLNMDNYGYGEFVLSVVGATNAGVTGGDAVTFSYYPVTATVTEDPGTGDADVTLNYNPNSSDIDKIIINVYDENGNLVSELSPATAVPPTTRVTLPFGNHNLPAGKYTIEATAYGTSGNALGKAYQITFTYKGKGGGAPATVVPGAGDAPNTGGIFAGLNISRSDLLITSLLVFLGVASCGLYFISKRNKSSQKMRKATK